jgi:outer membrane protein OmpA-like peptidoglycan-associated protein/Tol biopolymer transport system component
MKKYLILALLVIAFAMNSYAQINIKEVSFNSREDDFPTSLVENGKHLYFTSERSDNRQKIFVIEKTSAGWDFPELIDKNVNSGIQNGGATLTPDGQYMIFAAYEHNEDGFGRTDLYSARKINGEWELVRNLGSYINSSTWDSQPYLSSDGSKLYFASDRPGGFGGTDLYVSERTASGWGTPKNLGRTINTEYDEMTPIMSADSKILTFASNRPNGVGGYDIYISNFQNEGFTVPQNAGSPINTIYDEYYYLSVPNADIAYYASNKPGGTGNLDIYTVVPNPHRSGAVVLVSGVVSDAASGAPLGSDIIVTDLRTRKKVADFRSDDISGKYYVVLQPGRSYSITAQKPGYVFYSEKFDIESTDKGYEIEKNIQLSPTGTRLLVFFDFDKSVPKDESIPEMERIINYLRDNPDKNIQIEGHTDDQGTDEYNNKLSIDRAKAVREYLVAAGIDGSRISAVGYGKTKPLIPDKTEEARKMNRRVELKILE